MKLYTTTLFILIQISTIICSEINLQDIEIPDFDDFDVIREKCDRLGGNGTYDKLKASKENLQSCLQGFVDVTKLKDEVEAAKKTGSMDEVFGKYCAKRSKIESCVTNFTTVLKSCLESEEKNALTVTLDILKQLGEFICFRDGDRIAMFIAEGGVECIKDHTEGIKDCVNSTLKIVPAVSANSLPNLLIDKKKCDDLGKLQSCVVAELEKCKDSTPANIVDALFRFIKRSACTNNKNKRSIHNIMRRSVALAHNVFDKTALTNKLSEIMKQKCKENNPNKEVDTYDNLLKKLESMQNCITENLLSADPKIINKASPDTIKNHIQNCSNDFIKITETCLPEDEKYFPQFNVDMLKSVAEFILGSKDQILNSNNLKIEFINCFQRIKSDEKSRAKLVQCTVNDNEASDSFKKEIICGNVANTKNCVTNTLNTICIPDVNTNKFVSGLFNAIEKPCKQ